MARTKAKYYVIPFVIFLLLTELARYFPDKTFSLYALKSILVGGLLWFWRTHYRELFQPISTSQFLLALLGGVLVFVFWIGGEGYFPMLSTPKAISPLEQDFSSPEVVGAIFFRLFGAVLVVPIMEELFWRSFLMRFLIRKDFQNVPLGTYTHFSFWVVTFLFALEHLRVVPGFLAGAVYGALLCLSKNLRTSVLAHAVTNFALGVYVLVTQAWSFW